MPVESGQEELRQAQADVFERGDEVELAVRLLGELGSDVASVGGVMYRYAETTGLWSALSDDDLITRASGYAGAPVMATAGTRPLHVTHARAKGAVRLALSRVARPDHFDAPVPGIAFSNCFVAVLPDSIDSRVHSPDHRVRVGLPFPYDDRAQCPRFRRFLDEIFAGDADAAQKQELLQEFIGVCLIGRATAQQQALLLYGPTSQNGKTTFIRVISQLFPPGSVTSVALQSMAEPQHRARLRASLINMVSELPSKDLLESESVKAILAGDRISAKEVYRPVMEFVPRAGHIFAANELPTPADTGPAFWRRFAVVVFNRRFQGDGSDTRLAEYLIATEMPGIALWALQGAVNMLSRGSHASYTLPPSHTQALDEWRESSDQVMQFVREYTVPVDSPEQRTGARDMYCAYKTWADDTGHKHLSEPKFCQRMKKLGHAAVKPHNVKLYPLRCTYRPVGSAPPSQFLRPARVACPAPGPATPQFQAGT